MPNRFLDVVIFCPTGQDAHLISEFLIKEHITATVVRSMEEFCRQDHDGTGAFIVADEALSIESIERLNLELAAQDPWSDIPIILLTSGGARRRPLVEGLELFISSGSVSLLERPLQPLSLLSAIKVALRSRRRQFQVRELLRSQADATKMRDEFISVASHELKTPLTSLKLQAQMSQRQLELETEIPRAKLMNQFGSTINQIDRLTKLVDDMLDITRISTGRLQLVTTTFDLAQLVDELIERFLPLFTAAGIAVHRNLAPNAIGTWDAFKLEQVLNNLFSNAIRYAPSGPLTVTLEKRPEGVRLTVADSGHGIAPENLSRIFERFERATSNRGGLGLGLYITRQIIDLHHGSIRAESQVGKGTTFIVELPVT